MVRLGMVSLGIAAIAGSVGFFIGRATTPPTTETEIQVVETNAPCADSIAIAASRTEDLPAPKVTASAVANERGRAPAEVIEHPPTPQPETPDEAVEPAPAGARTELLPTATANPGATRAPQTLPLVDIQNSLVKAETTTAADLRSSEPKRFLAKTALKNFSRIEPSLIPATLPRALWAKRLGSYKGGVNFIIAGRARGRVAMILREASVQPYIPALRVEVDDGLTPRSVHMGGLEQFKTLAGQTEALFIEASDRSYLQLYFSDTEELVLGNFYEKGTSGPYERTGTLRLERVTN